LWRLGRARLIVRTGAGARATALAEKAVELLRSTDALVTLADALGDLAAVRAAAGHAAEAELAALEALELHEAKGNLVAAAETRASLAAITAGQRM
jgi:hypothetical protein